MLEIQPTLTVLQRLLKCQHLRSHRMNLILCWNYLINICFFFLWTRSITSLSSEFMWSPEVIPSFGKVQLTFWWRASLLDVLAGCSSQVCWGNEDTRHGCLMVGVIYPRLIRSYHNQNSVNSHRVHCEKTNPLCFDLLYPKLFIIFWDPPPLSKYN